MCSSGRDDETLVIHAAEADGHLASACLAIAVGVGMARPCSDFPERMTRRDAHFVEPSEDCVSSRVRGTKCDPDMTELVFFECGSDRYPDRLSSALRHGLLLYVGAGFDGREAVLPQNLGDEPCELAAGELDGDGLMPFVFFPQEDQDQYRDVYAVSWSPPRLVAYLYDTMKLE